MDLLEKAIAFEYAGNKMYQENADKAKRPDVKHILQLLANDELSHAEFLTKLKNRQLGDIKLENSLDEIFSILENSVFSNPDYMDQDITVCDVLQASIRIEEEARKRYIAQLNATKNPRVRKALEVIAREEEQHIILLNNLEAHLRNPTGLVEKCEDHGYYGK